jgi:hypothetical protein
MVEEVEVGLTEAREEGEAVSGWLALVPQEQVWLPKPVTSLSPLI